MAAIVIALVLILAFGRGSRVTLAELVVGDCLFVRTAPEEPDEGPIGEERVVVEALVTFGAERAGCTASHGHEALVVSTVALKTPGPSGEMPTMLDRDGVDRLTRPVCEAAFPEYVGQPLDDAVYVTFPVFPDVPDWVAAGRRTICLVARADGQWMDHPARGSGE